MFLAYKTYSTQPKNALDKDFEKYLEAIDRTLIENNKIDASLLDIQDDYKKLCAKHNRCKPRDMYFHHQENQIILHGSHVSFTFLKSKN